MNTVKTSFVTAATSLMAACILQAQSEPMVPSSSSQWAEVYQPPYKVPTELPADSALRSDLFELLRSRVTPEHRFSGSLKVYRNWALFVGRTVDKNGNSLKHPPLDNDDSVALWLRTKQGWRLVDFSFGHSDAFYIIWPEMYGAPAELLGIKTNP